MTETTTYQRHERLMTRMADAQKIDLDIAILRGELSPEEYSDAVLACTGCSVPEACERHMEEGRFGVPRFCRNGDMLARLAKVSSS
ncbi:MAG: DUF6455 family protein [Silicimonas sp.]|jgi:hypothetical protein|nr:DUF6455 family protein [Silicimonas sp.]